MVQSILIGLVAGLAAGLLFVAPFGGTPLAIPLFALTGVPIAIAGFGWGVSAALVAAVAGAAIVFAVVDMATVSVYGLLFAMPVAWATAVAVLPRPAASGGGWRSIGEVLIHAALAMAVGVIGIGLIFGYDPPTLTDQLTAMWVDWAASVYTGPGAPPTAADVQPLAAFFVLLMPAIVGVAGLAVVVGDLYVAAKTVRFSDLLKRPEEPMWSATMPVAVPAALVLAAALAFAPGPVGDAAKAVAGALGGAVALVGLAVIHALSRPLTWRGPLLAAVYALLLISAFLMVPLALLGIAESVFHLRARRLKPRGPTPT